ncbi:hypothetical protein [Actinacidiphila acididurans]|uniref:GP-PDE domain-containing protein n=1 Tax=Actinacidiphila acididurans TaxID=2784346 RepID=A0ABS2U2X9_9ACTN|nr:hypothetical protein [Actinacidiphila acididurans]MBM9509955.1 hypothetical protein [Actinacidiphila acididurans]
MTPADAHALAMAEQTGADGIYTDWHQALKDAAATWGAEGQARPSGLTARGEQALASLTDRLGLTTSTTTTAATTTGRTDAAAAGRSAA